MFIELVDSLRCLTPHEDGWLVVASSRMEDRHIVDGVLGCPICHAQYPIVNGVAYLGAETPDPGDAHRDDMLAAAAARPPHADAMDEALRLAALLGLTESGGTVMLAGGWSALAAPLRDVVDEQRLLLIDPVDALSALHGFSVVRTAGRVPLADASLRAAAVDERTSTPTMLAATVRALQSRGRLVADASAPVPADVTELARDDRHWVAERAAVASRPVQLGVVRGRK
jgi:hypothetical protein